MILFIHTGMRSRRRARSQGRCSLHLHYDLAPPAHHVDINWPFPETSSSPIWRAAREREKRERESRPPEGQPLTGAGIPQSPRSSELLEVLVGPSTAQRLNAARLHTLGDVAEAHARGERWWVFVRGIGEARARKIAQRVSQALNPEDSAAVPASGSSSTLMSVGIRWPGTSSAEGSEGG